MWKCKWNIDILNNVSIRWILHFPSHNNHDIVGNVDFVFSTFEDIIMWTSKYKGIKKSYIDQTYCGMLK